MDCRRHFACSPRTRAGRHRGAQATQAGTTLWAVSGQTLTSGNVYTVFLLGDANAVHGVLRVDN